MLLLALLLFMAPLRALSCEALSDMSNVCLGEKESRRGSSAGLKAVLVLARQLTNRSLLLANREYACRSAANRVCLCSGLQ